MRVKIAGTFGPATGTEVVLSDGEHVNAGSAPAEPALAVSDPRLAPLHFTVRCDSGGATIHGDAAHETAVNGIRVIDPRLLGDGDLITAGESQFYVTIESAPLGHVLQYQALPSFAILDAAREQRVPAFLSQSGAQHQSLYEGARGEALGAVAPYLVMLHGSPAILDALARYAWGRSWAVFLTSRLPFEQLRRHFRHFLL